MKSKKLLDIVLRLALSMALAAVATKSYAAEAGTVETEISEETNDNFTQNSSGDSLQGTTVSPEEMEKLLQDLEENGHVVYDSEWGENAEPDWSDTEIPEDVNPESLEKEYEYGTLLIKAGVHEDIMSYSDAIFVTIANAEGTENKYALSKINGYASTINLDAGNYIITGIEPANYEAECKVSVSSYEFTVEANSSVSVDINIGPAKETAPAETVIEPVEEKKSNKWLKILIAVGSIVLVGGTGLFIYSKKNNQIN